MFGKDIKTEELPGKLNSFWLASTPGTNYPPLKEGIHVDVAILGGGIAGIASAYMLKERGVKVAVLEAHRIVSDVTGHTTAKITALHGLIYKYLIEKFGKDNAQIYADAQTGAIEKIAEIVKEKNISCDFIKTKAYTYTISKSEVGDIETEIKAAQGLGLPASYAEKIELPYKVAGAVCFENQAKFHPRKYLLALAGEISKDGSYVFENTRALKIRDEDPVTIETDKGKITADKVIVATHFPFVNDGDYYKTMCPQRSYALGIRLNEPVPEELFISTEDSFHSIRSTPSEDGEILFVGGQPHAAGMGGNILARYGRLEKFVRENFDVKSIDYIWSTQDNFTTDRVPYIGRLTDKTENIYVATGFCGWGMTNSHVAAEILSDAILGKENAWTRFFDSLREKPREYAEKFIEDEEVVKPQRLPDFSPACTHMGCIASWNNAEETWDCPCHGSRFGKDGEVIHGPAQKDLE